MIQINHPWNKIWIGILTGFLVPITCYGILLVIYERLDIAGVINSEGMQTNFRERTIALISIIANIIPIQYFNKNGWIDAMRGIVFPTFFFVVLWMYYYGKDLLNF